MFIKRASRPNDLSLVTSSGLSLIDENINPNRLWDRDLKKIRDRHPHEALLPKTGKFMYNFLISI